VGLYHSPVPEFPIPPFQRSQRSHSLISLYDISMSKALFTISKEQVRGGKAGVEGESLYIELVEVGRIELPTKYLLGHSYLIVLATYGSM